MTAFHVFLVAVGLVIIAISYIISEKITQNVQKEDGQNNYNVLLDLESANMKEQIDSIIKDEINSAMDKTEDRLSQISNEKIMAVSEYSDQVLEKINQNHTEVVFLYNMLNEKEESIKKLYKNNNIESVKKEEPNKDKAGHIRNNVKYNQNLKKVEDLKTDDTQEIIEQKLKNEQILKLYSEGKSIIEIARMLEIGQGEIKLVIGLSQGEKA